MSRARVVHSRQELKNVEECLRNPNRGGCQARTPKRKWAPCDNCPPAPNLTNNGSLAEGYRLHAGRLESPLACRRIFDEVAMRLCLVLLPDQTLMERSVHGDVLRSRLCPSCGNYCTHSLHSLNSLHSTTTLARSGHTSEFTLHCVCRWLCPCIVRNAPKWFEAGQHFLRKPRVVTQIWDFAQV